MCHKPYDWWSAQFFNRSAWDERHQEDGSPAPTLSIKGGQQTGQQGPASITTNDFFVENILEELDASGEFYLDTVTRMLYVVPPSGTESAFARNDVSVIAPVHPRVIQVRGSSPTTFAHDINIKGLAVRHSAPTYMSDYEMPSGGDWSIHRGGAIFLDGTEDIAVDDVHVDKAGGNGIFLSQHAWRTSVTNNVISYAGDSAILLVGSTELMNGTRDTYPAYTQIQGNLCYEMGYYGKQTAAYFKSIAYRSNVTNNVFFNSLHWSWNKL